MSSTTIHPESDAEVKNANDNVMVWPPTDLMNKSLGIFTVDNPLRQWCLSIATPNNYFDQFILFCIVANSIVMAMTDYQYIQGMPGTGSDSTAFNTKADR